MRSKSDRVNTKPFWFAVLGRNTHLGMQVKPEASNNARTVCSDRGTREAHDPLTSARSGRDQALHRGAVAVGEQWLGVAQVVITDIERFTTASQLAHHALTDLPGECEALVCLAEAERPRKRDW